MRFIPLWASLILMVSVGASASTYRCSGVTNGDQQYFRVGSESVVEISTDANGGVVQFHVISGLFAGTDMNLQWVETSSSTAYSSSAQLLPGQNLPTLIALNGANGIGSPFIQIGTAQSPTSGFNVLASYRCE